MINVLCWWSHYVSLIWLILEYYIFINNICWFYWFQWWQIIPILQTVCLCNTVFLTILQYMKKIIKQISCNHPVATGPHVYQNNMKPFDTVTHESLLYKISRYEIKDPLHGWNRSCLSIRSHCGMNSCKSKSAPATSGNSQRSVLWPLIFVIYINHLYDSVKWNVYIFADDAEIYRSIWG